MYQARRKQTEPREHDHLRAVPRGMEYHFYLTEAIEMNGNIHNLCDTLRMANQNDMVFIHLNSPGGELRVAAQIISAMKDSNSNVVTCAEGEVYSAASLIFFAGSGYSISNFSNFMIHNASTFSGGVLTNIKNDIDNVESWITSMYKEVYVPFFTEEEIDSILESGKDFYFNPIEIIGRIDRVRGDSI